MKIGWEILIKKIIDTSIIDRKDLTILLSQLCFNAWKAKWRRTSLHVSRRGIHSIEYIYIYTYIWTLADVHCAWVKCEQINSWKPWWRKFRVTESLDKATRKQRLSKIRRQTTHIYIYRYIHVIYAATSRSWVDREHREKISAVSSRKN